MQYPGDACSSLPGLLRVSYLWCNLKLSEVNAFFNCSKNDVAIVFVSSFKCEHSICKIKTSYTAPSRVRFLVALVGSSTAELLLVPEVNSHKYNSHLSRKLQVLVPHTHLLSHSPKLGLQGKYQMCCYLTWLVY